ncbi:coiled-coil domain-containing protein 112-like [Achroia grisella]|uniref:coiled-coil domain-containing protein 112-like n=1 Tax=Achroia grisella TaxID=688607 RepID=UPI0027D2259B|nr:coiled-coil domain-containing protein 112-like [Achroia grisella]
MTSDIVSYSSFRNENYFECNIAAKIRRLKIQEGLINQNIVKLLDRENNIVNLNNKINCEYKAFITKIQNTYIEIKNLFESIKANTNSRESLQSIDIDVVKNDVFDIESKMKEFKKHLQSKLSILKSQEQHLTKDMYLMTHQSAKSKIQTKFDSKSYNDIIPSPVKTIIYSPFKYTEVEEYQKFMSTHRRYGGWNEYNHNVFVVSWKKYFDTEKSVDAEFQYSNHENFPNFLIDIGEKIPGITKDEVISHIQWYTKYLYFKNRQQKALDKWRASKQNTNKSHNVQVMLCFDNYNKNSR